MEVCDISYVSCILGWGSILFRGMSRLRVDYIIPIDNNILSRP